MFSCCFFSWQIKSFCSADSHMNSPWGHVAHNMSRALFQHVALSSTLCFALCHEHLSSASEHLALCTAHKSQAKYSPNWDTYIALNTNIFLKYLVDWMYFLHQGTINSLKLGKVLLNLVSTVCRCLEMLMATSCEELTHWKRPWCWEGWGQEEKWTTEDEMAGWYHRLDGHEFE